jgi:glucose/arabinose dehydrogenase
MKTCRFHRLGGLLLWSIVLLGCGRSGDGSGSSGGGSPPPPPAALSLKLESVGSTFSSPVFMTAVPGDTTRLFVVEQGGRIQIFDLTTKSVRATFLDISSSGSNLISSGGERGLLGMSFDPSYNTNRRFYVYYTDTSGNIVIARNLRDQNNPDLADSSSPPVVLLTIPHPGQSNHNGGMLTFGPDGCLYAGPGDGGGAGDPGNNGQNPNVRLGKLLRMDPSTGGACTFGTTNPFSGGGGDPLIWSLGLRNPWRFSFDPLTHDLYIADVGQDTREEIDISLAVNGGGKGLNYGWNIMEGMLCFNAASCNQVGLTFPVLDYDHSQGCSIIGGYVYRGSAIPALPGTYFYGDLCSGFVRSFRFVGGMVTEQHDWPLLPPGGNITSFGEDAQGELYLMTLQGGLFRIVPN